MTTQQKLVQMKLSLLGLGKYLQNVSEACCIHRHQADSHQNLYDVKKAYERQVRDRFSDPSCCRHSSTLRKHPESSTSLFIKDRASDSRS